MTFKTFAIKRIQWAVSETALHLRAGAFAHRSLQKWADLTALPSCVPMEAPARGKDGTDSETTLADLLPDPKASTDGNLLQESETAQLWRTIEESLPGRLGAVIRRHYGDGLTFRDIARAEGVSHQRVNQWHQNALKTLRTKSLN